MKQVPGWRCLKLCWPLWSCTNTFLDSLHSWVRHSWLLPTWAQGQRPGSSGPFAEKDPEDSTHAPQASVLSQVLDSCSRMAPSVTRAMTRIETSAAVVFMSWWPGGGSGILVEPERPARLQTPGRPGGYKGQDASDCARQCCDDLAAVAGMDAGGTGDGPGGAEAREDRACDALLPGWQAIERGEDELALAVGREIEHRHRTMSGGGIPAQVRKVGRSRGRDLRVRCELVRTR